MTDARREYGDIIDRERPVSQKHPRMPRLKRAAQFSPFAALTGYDDLVAEAARETEEEILLDADRIEELNDTLVQLFSRSEPPEARFTLFRPDKKKAGGAYVTVTGRAARYDPAEQTITLADGTEFPLRALKSVEWDGRG